MIDIKKIFKWIFLMFLLINFIILIITCFCFIDISSTIVDKMNKHRSLIAVMNRDTNMKYLNKKMQLLLEDMIVIMKAYDLLIDWNVSSYEKIESKIDDYFYSAANLFEDKSELYATFDQPWFIDIDKDILHRRFKGIWITYKEAKEFTHIEEEERKALSHIGLITDLMISIFEKHLNWKDKMYVTFDFIYFTFQTGIFYKFPGSRQKKPTIFDCQLAPNTGPSYYDPRCRPYYIQAVNSPKNIIISQPYKFAFGNYGNDICIKSKEFKNANVGTKSMKEYLFCAAFTFLDFHLIKNQIEEILQKAEKVIYLIYYNPEDNASKVIFNSLYYNEEVQCTQIDSNSNYDCESIDLFVIYSKQLLDSMNKIGLSDDEYVQLFNEAKDKFNQNIILPMSIIAKSSDSLFDITVDNMKDDDLKRFSFILDRSYSIENKALIESIGSESTFYFFPLIGGFNYDDDYAIKKSKDYNYYLLIQEKNTSITQASYNVIIIFCFELFLYFIYLIIWNELLWALFIFISYYFVKAFVYPLNEITSLYISIGKKIMVTDQTNPSFISNNKQIKKSQIKRSKTQSIIESAMYLDEIITNYLMNLFGSKEFPEVKESITILKAFNLVIDSKQKEPVDPINLIMKKNNYLEMTTFFEAVLFLFECFYSHVLGKKCDYKILKLLIENIVSILLRDFNNQNEENKKEMIKYINDFYNTKILKVIQLAKKQIKEDEQTQLHELELAFDCLDNLSQLEENIIYSYSIHNTMIIDERIRNEYNEYQFNPFDSVNEEQLKLSKLMAEDKTKKRKALGIDPMSPKKNELIKDNNNKRETIDKKELEEKYKPLIKIDHKNIQKEINETIDNLNAYLKLLNKNKKNNENTSLKRTITLDDINEDDDLIDNENESNIIHKNKNEDELTIWILECANKLKELSALSILANYYMIIKNKSQGLLMTKEALNKLYEFEKYINQYKHITQLNEAEWKKTNFILTTTYVIFIEKILFSFGLFYEIYHHTYNALFVYINILDLGPMYSISIRRMILIKLLTIVKDKQTYTLSQSDSVDSFNTQINLPQYINHNLVRIKLSTILNITSTQIYKQITFLFDLGNKFMKNKLIKSTMQLFQMKIMKYNKDIILHFCGFDSILHIINDYCPQEKSPKITKITKDSSVTSKSMNDEKQDEEDEMNTFFKFLEKYNEETIDHIIIPKEPIDKIDDKRIRADNALYNTIKHCFLDWKDINDKKKNQKKKNQHENQLSNLNNYLVMVADINCYFHEKPTNWKEMSKLLFDKKISLVIILTYNEKMGKDELVKNKIKIYQDFLQKHVIDGHLFIMKSISMLKFIFNTVFPFQFSEFNTELVYHYLKNIEQKDNSK